MNKFAILMGKYAALKYAQEPNFPAFGRSPTMPSIPIPPDAPTPDIARLSPTTPAIPVTPTQATNTNTQNQNIGSFNTSNQNLNQTMQNSNNAQNSNNQTFSPQMTQTIAPNFAPQQSTSMRGTMNTRMGSRISQRPYMPPNPNFRRTLPPIGTRSNINSLRLPPRRR